jgi:hypothetical protein
MSSVGQRVNSEKDDKGEKGLRKEKQGNDIVFKNGNRLKIQD